ncbi:head GIN domain-containing protein [Cellulomonas triticagri]|uniref:DUF2807 domain-containing protein n=1 Tax=Cellulomonas triticagri TaxID=2483352 RepID=A0A3M2JQG1_9CELL|nr:head GIN domain-containing protein [Cellulomonas triticagri]RMI12448.1 DUF2807 domain-containing protein [Cellulomonas triticagri]
MARRATTVAATGTLGVVLALGLSGCVGDLGGPAVTREVEISDVDAVALGTSGDLVVRRGATPSLTVTASERLHDRLVSEVRDGVLVLEAERGPGRGSDLSYELVLPELADLTVSGSGDVSGTDVTGDRLRVLVQGSGEVELGGLDVEDALVSVKGSGDVGLSGRTASLSVSIEGSGDVDTDDLRAATASVSIEGSGEVDLHATDRLTVSIAGSGSVTYSGSPQVEQRIEGSGRVSRD